VEIDPGEIDAHYQLGRIARDEKRHEDAIRHFGEVVKRDEKHSRHEVWREIGSTYLESTSFEHAQWALEKFVAARPHDPEGLYLRGEALTALDRKAEAAESYRRAIEAADTMPAYRRREVSRWKKAAAQRLAAG
jgi:tetratricopeptide (TPR) repeat protein